MRGEDEKGCGLDKWWGLALSLAVNQMVGDGGFIEVDGCQCWEEKSGEGKGLIRVRRKTGKVWWGLPWKI